MRAHHLYRDPDSLACLLKTATNDEIDSQLRSNSNRISFAFRYLRIEVGGLTTICVKLLRRVIRASARPIASDPSLPS